MFGGRAGDLEAVEGTAEVLLIRGGGMRNLNHDEPLTAVES